MNKNELAAVKERLQENLPSIQISNMLDTFLFEAIKPVILWSDYFDLFVSDLLSQVHDDFRRKYGIDNKEKLESMLFKYLVTKNREEKFYIIKNLGLDRSIITTCLESIYKISFPYNNINHPDMNKFVKLNKRLRIANDKLEILLQTSHLNYYYYLDFKSMVVEKYIRLAYSETLKSSKSTAITVDEEELFKNLLLSICKAIDKYNPNKGALTSYIMWWFKDAKTNPSFDHTYNHAYNVSSTGRRRLSEDLKNGISSNTNISIPLSDIENSKEDFVDNLEENLLSDFGCKKIIEILSKFNRDKIKYFLLKSGIPINLTTKEIEVFNKENY